MVVFTFVVYKHLPVHSTQMLFMFYHLFTVFIFLEEALFIFVPRGGFIVRVEVVDVFVVELLARAIHLQVHLLVDIFELQRGYKVVFLEIRLGKVVHGLRSLMFASLLLHLFHDHDDHAGEHQSYHQTDARADSHPVELVAGLPASVGTVG